MFDRLVSLVSTAARRPLVNAVLGAKGIQVFIHSGSRDPHILHLLALTRGKGLHFPNLSFWILKLIIRIVLILWVRCKY